MYGSKMPGSILPGRMILLMQWNIELAAFHVSINDWQSSRHDVHFIAFQLQNFGGLCTAVIS